MSTSLFANVNHSSLTPSRTGYPLVLPPVRSTGLGKPYCDLISYSCVCSRAIVQRACMKQIG